VSDQEHLEEKQITPRVAPFIELYETIFVRFFWFHAFLWLLVAALFVDPLAALWAALGCASMLILHVVGFALWWRVRGLIERQALEPKGLVKFDVYSIDEKTGFKFIRTFERREDGTLVQKNAAPVLAKEATTSEEQNHK